MKEDIHFHYLQPEPTAKIYRYCQGLGLQKNREICWGLENEHSPLISTNVAPLSRLYLWTVPISFAMSISDCREWNLISTGGRCPRSSRVMTADSEKDKFKSSEIWACSMLVEPKVRAAKKLFNPSEDASCSMGVENVLTGLTEGSRTKAWFSWVVKGDMSELQS